ncbi:Tar ligand binding domain-containing protein, partial [Cuspidothrix issatschenkoi LEGE 03284]|uniref:Tar ligand binding domain-containing protein n=1 Tax=Cuspidothrix issatschenkoi TaxID=230752 RepID=UPI0018825F15
MFRNLSLQARLIGGFLFIALIVLVMGIIGWSGFSRMDGYIKVFSANTFPSTVNLWKVTNAQSRLLSSQNRLISSNIAIEERNKEINRFKTMLQAMKEGWESYRKLPRDPEEDRIYQEAFRMSDKMLAATEEFLRLNQEAMRYGMVSPRKIQVQLLIEGKSNTPEFKTAVAVEKAFDKMSDFATTQLEPSLDEASKATIQLLTYNADLADKTTKISEKDASETNTFLILCSMSGFVTAGTFGSIFSKPIVQKVDELVKVSQSIANNNSVPQMQLSYGQDELSKLQTSFYTVASKIGELVNIAQKISSGDLTVQIQQADTQDEIGKLQNA